MIREYDKKKEIIALVFAAVMLWGVPLFCLFFAKDIVGFWGHLVYVLTTVALYALLMSIFKRRHLLWILSPMLLLYLADIVPVVAYGSTPSLMFTYSILGTHKKEITELLSAYIPLIAVLLVFWVAYFVLTYRYVRKEFFFGKKTRMIVGCAAGAWLLVAGVGASVYALGHNVKAFRTVLKVCPFNEVYNIQRIVLIKHNVSAGQAEYPSYRFDATSTAEDDELVVLVIGETGRYRNWQINGYSRETSPRMMARSSQLISLDSCYTIANLTTVSVPLLLSCTQPDDLNHYYDNPSVVRAFREAGYHTSWIANQSFNNPLLIHISGQCDYVYYHDVSHIFYDVELVHPMEEALASCSGKQFVTIHSKGSHFKYSARYPEEVACFKPDLYDVSGKDFFALLDRTGFSFDAGNPQSSVANIARRILTNSYDNSIRFVDTFLDSVICSLEHSGRPAVMLYVADHGENLLDDERNLMLHGQGDGSIYEYHVPCFVWASESYKERYPERWQTMQQNSSKHVSTLSVYHTMLDLGGVSVASYNPEKSLASPLLKAESKAYKLDGDLHVKTYSTEEP